MDESSRARLDQLIEAVTTISPNHLQDWREIQNDVLDPIRDEGLNVSKDEIVLVFKEWGMDQPDIDELRRRLRHTFGR